MDYRLQIARRYLFGQREVSLISVITGVSTAGVTLGVAALIVVLSVMNGFYEVVRGLLVSVDPHVRIESTSQQGLAQADSLVRLASELEGVTSAAPYVEGKALLLHGGSDTGNRVVQVRGLLPGAAGDSAESAAATPEAQYGAFDLSPRDGVPGIVVDLSVAQRVGLAPGQVSDAASRVGLLSAPALEQTLTQILGPPPVQRFEVRGLTQMQAPSSQSRVFIPLSAAQRLFRMEDRVTGISLRLVDLERAGAVKAQLQAQLSGDRFAVETWYDAQQSLYDAMRVEKWGASAVLLLIIIVAAFNIVGSLTMVVIEKRRDVGALQAMGVSRKDVRRIFLLEGLLIGGAGTGLGLTLGLGLAYLQQHFKLVPMAQAESFLIDAYPVSVHALDVALIAGAALALCTLAAIYPAMRAASIAPAQAVHMDA